MKKRLAAALCAASILWAGAFVPARAEQAAPDGGPAALAQFLDEARSTGFAYVLEGQDQVFDGARCLQGSAEDMARLQASSQGTLLVRYNTTADTNQIIFAAGGAAEAEACGALLANAAPSVDRQRVQFPGGMQANLADTRASGSWHTFVYSVDASQPGVTEGKTVTSFDGSAVTQYPDYASWFNANETVNGLKFLSIGNVEGGLPGAGGFVGRIAAVAFIPRALSQQQAAQLTGERWGQAPQLLYAAENIVIEAPSQAVALEQTLAGRIAALDEMTVIVKFKNTNTGVGSLFSVSDPAQVAAHFHIYQNNDRLGFEYRDRDDPFYEASCTIYAREWNTVAFSAGRDTGYRLFANGALGASLEKTGADYRFLSDAASWSSCSVGKTVRGNDPEGYPFTGTIERLEIYAGALPDEELAARTAQTQRGDAFVFYAGDATGSAHFRIPFLWNTPDGTLIAGADANFGSGGDSAENIDIALRRKPNAAGYGAMEGWQDAFVPDAMHMLDYADENGYRQRSASFIDAVIVQDTLGGGRILLLADAWAWNGGLFQHLADASGGTEMRSVARGDGFCTIGGKKYLLLSDQNRKGNANGQTGNINENTDRSRFNYAADIYGAPDENGRYPVYHLNGTPRAYKAVGTPVSDANLSLGGMSAYSLTKEYELCRDGTLLTVAQNAESQSAGPVEVPMKIFYEDSELQMYNTSYIMQFYSDDGGASWHTDKIISGMVKRESSRYYILGPGRGLQIQNGAYAGRLIVPVYYQGAPDAEVIYSDDGGRTWKHGESVSSIYGLSEAAPVEMPDGSLKLFLRNTSVLGGTVVEATSTDGGQTWRDVKSTFGNNSAGINCQMSAVRLGSPVRSRADGKEYPALLLSCANRKDRTNGRLFMGLLKEDGAYPGGARKYRIDWEYQYDVTPAGTLYAYSCLSELNDGRVALLYESSPSGSWDEGLQRIYYREFQAETLMN